MSTWEVRDEELARLAREALAGRVARSVAHDINDLLMGVTAAAEEGMKSDRLSELRRALEMNARYGEQIARLVRVFQMVFAEQPASGPASSADLGRALELSVRLCEKDIARRSVTLRKRFGSLPRVQADIGPLQQVLIELLHAALGATPSGGVLELAAWETGEQAVIAVTANAGPPGKTGSDADGVHRGQNACGTSQSGRGTPDRPGQAADNLGLAVAGSTLRRYGGELTADRTLGKSPRFIASLRLAAQSGSP